MGLLSILIASSGRVISPRTAIQASWQTDGETNTILNIQNKSEVLQLKHSVSGRLFYLGSNQSDSLQSHSKRVPAICVLMTLDMGASQS